MAKRYTLKLNLSLKSIDLLIKKIDILENHTKELEKVFVMKSLDYIEERAIYYIMAQTRGDGNLASSFEIDTETKTLVNTCFYAALVEYGTGIYGSENRPNFVPKSYQYDVNGHGMEGWKYVKDGRLYWTQGMRGINYMHDAVLDYIDEQPRIFEECFDEVMGKVLKG